MILVAMVVECGRESRMGVVGSMDEKMRYKLKLVSELAGRDCM